MLALAKIKINFEHDPEKERPIDAPVLRGDNAKLVEATDWQPEISLDQSLKDILSTTEAEECDGSS